MKWNSDVYGVCFISSSLVPVVQYLSGEISYRILPLILSQPRTTTLFSDSFRLVSFSVWQIRPVLPSAHRPYLHGGCERLRNGVGNVPYFNCKCEGAVLDRSLPTIRQLLLFENNHHQLLLFKNSRSIHSPTCIWAPYCHWILETACLPNLALPSPSFSMSTLAPPCRVFRSSRSGVEFPLPHPEAPHPRRFCRKGEPRSSLLEFREWRQSGETKKMREEKSFHWSFSCSLSYFHSIRTNLLLLITV